MGCAIRFVVKKERFDEYHLLQLPHMTFTKMFDCCQASVSVTYSDDGKAREGVVVTDDKLVEPLSGTRNVVAGTFHPPLPELVTTGK